MLNYNGMPLPKGLVYKHSGIYYIVNSTVIERDSTGVPYQEVLTINHINWQFYTLGEIHTEVLSDLRYASHQDQIRRHYDQVRTEDQDLPFIRRASKSSHG